ncbi:MAG: RDD family protein [Candidatus Dormibacteraeota bacterium]|nr:RDD family protein [Candidatus Dormibacteraeota bacterium]
MAQLAGFWARFAGLLLDGLLFLVVELLLGAVFTSTSTEVVGGLAITVRTGSSLPTAIMIILELAYFSWFWSTRGASLGQQLVGIRVVDSETFGPLKPSQAVVRYIGYLISGLPFLLGYIWAAFDPKKQGWMDKLAGTQVVRSR